MNQQIVVVTGIGIVSPLGANVAAAWPRFVAGESGLGHITTFDPTDYPSHVAGECHDFDADTHFDTKEQRKMDRFIQLGLVAADEAWHMAGFEGALTDEKAPRAGCILGSGIGGMPAMEEQHSALLSKGPRRVSPYFIPSMLPNLLAGHASMRLNLQGVNSCSVTACASGLHSLGEAAQTIARGEADVMVTGGAEACVCRLAVAGFGNAKALSTQFNDTPTAASRPFDDARDGFVIGEGAAVLVLESRAHAEARGATVLAEVAGFGASADAFHMTLPEENGRGATNAMAKALKQANLSGDDVSAVSAHGTSTPAGDAIEARAIAAVTRPDVPVCAIKSQIGHGLGAAGAMAAAVGVLSLRDQTLPPVLNLENKSQNIPLTHIHTQPNAAVHLDNILVNAFGFGGTNASVVLKKA